MLACAEAAAQTSCERHPDAREAFWPVNVGEIIVQRDAPLGKLLINRNLRLDREGLPLLECTGRGDGQSNLLTIPGATPVPEWPGYYTSPSFPGVAVRVELPKDVGSVPFTVPATRWAFQPDYSVSGPIWLRAIKIGPITNFNMPDVEIFQWTVPETGGGILSVARANLTGSVTQVACQPVSTAITVPMNRTATMDFKSVGDTAGDTAFSIALDCDEKTQVSVELDGTQLGRPENGTVALTPESTAQGFGLQVLYDGNPVVLGKTFDVGLTSAGGREHVNFSARYIRTSETMKGGSANATASYTFTYN